MFTRSFLPKGTLIYKSEALVTLDTTHDSRLAFDSIIRCLFNEHKQTIVSNQKWFKNLYQPPFKAYNLAMGQTSDGALARVDESHFSTSEKEFIKFKDVFFDNMFCAKDVFCLYDFGSYFNHSCVPNVRVFYKSKVFIPSCF